MVDPYGYQTYDNYGFYEDDPSWLDLISQGINRGADVARVAVGGYPPGSTVVYSPTTQYPGATPQPVPMPAPGVTPQPQPASGIQLSTNTLIILGLVGFAFIFGKGRR